MSIPAAYVTIIAIWSTTPLAIQWSAMDTGFTFAVMARMVIGVVLCGMLLGLLRVRMPWHREARHTYLAAGLGLFGAMFLTYWAARFVTSGLISVLFGLSPLVTSLLAAVWLGEKALTPPRLAGMALGLAGLLVVFGDNLTAGSGLPGLLALLAAVCIYSASLVWVKRIGDHSPPLAITTGSLAVSLPLFILAWWLMDGHWPTHWSTRGAAATVYLGVFGSALGFVLYYYVMKHLEAGRVALITLVTPVLALWLGSVLNGEVVSSRVWWGTACIMLGLAIYQGRLLWGVLASGRSH